MKAKFIYRKNSIFQVVLIALFFLSYAQSSYAYIDPGVTGYLYQIIYLAIAGIIGYFAGIKHIIAKIFRKKEKTKSSVKPK